ncbi:MAG: hypothetical protein H7331_04140 [Bacteroidia bacterium]|nr:hypothetical protein [Bacteroidia bacterium]
MAVYKFRVTFEDDSDLFRDIEIKSDATFLQLHNTIVQAFEFVSNELASFYTTDDSWRKENEISLEDMGQENLVLMRKAILANYIEDPHQKFIYTFDFMNEWNFMVELLKIIPKEDTKIKYPAITKREGDVPKSFKNIKPAHLGDNELDEDWDDVSPKKKHSAKDEFDDLDEFDEEEFDGDYDTDEEGGSHGGAHEEY